MNNITFYNKIEFLKSILKASPQDHNKYNLFDMWRSTIITSFKHSALEAIMTAISMIMIISLWYGETNLIDFFVFNLLIPTIGFIVLIIIFYWLIIIISLNKFFIYSKIAQNDNSSKIRKILIPIVVWGITAYIIEIVIAWVSLIYFNKIQADWKLIVVVSIISIISAISWNLAAYYRIKRAGWNQFFLDNPGDDILRKKAIEDLNKQMIFTFIGLIITLVFASLVFAWKCWDLGLGLGIDIIAIYGGILAIFIVYIKMVIDNNKNYPEIYPEIEYLFPK